ncbi:MAG: DegQ family serine endoprotease [Sedimentisphaerales bacterium]|nr:DegQ family serine endoprotease [Sedimentisphaerales bacterium]
MKSKKLFMIVSCLVFILFLNSFSFASPAAKEKIEALRGTGEVFAEIAAKVTPAVVFVSIEQEVVQQAPNMFFNDPFEEFNDEFFERFFGKPLRRRGQQPKERKQMRRGQGSGFIISDDGFILTNNHVVADADKITVKLADEREFTAKLIGTDPETDVAVIKIDANDLPYAELGDSDELKVGQWVIAIGNPFGLSHTVTAGIVSAKGRNRIGLTQYEDFIQTDAAINFGNSGGPLLDIDGKVVGINTAIFSRSGGYMGIGFAIPINMAKYVHEQLIAKGKVTRGYLGIYGDDLSPEMAKLLGAKDTKGVVIDKVIEDSPAEKDGLKRGDIIVKLEGKPLENWDSFKRLIARIAPGTKVNLTVIRDGKEKDVAVELETRESLADVPTEDSKEAKQIGITVRDLTSEFAQRFGFDEDQTGVVVDSVDPTSDAAMKGITPGTLIIEVNREKVSNTKDFWRLIKEADDSVLFYAKYGEVEKYVVVKFKE